LKFQKNTKRAYDYSGFQDQILKIKSLELDFDIIFNFLIQKNYIGYKHEVCRMTFNTGLVVSFVNGGELPNEENLFAKTIFKSTSTILD
jgi:hypothetical protein